MAKTANIYARIEPEVKKEAESILEELGIPVSVAINMFYKKIIASKGMPFEVKIEDSGITDITNWGKYYMTYSFSNYCPEMKDVSGNSSSFLKISSPSYTGKIKGNADNYIYSFLDTNQISVAYDDDSLGLTGGTVTFTATDNNTLNLSVTRSGSKTAIIDTTDNETRKKWFPMQIHSDTSYLLNNASYGWWN